MEAKGLCLQKKCVTEDQFLQDLKILLRKCQLMSHIQGKQPLVLYDIDGTLVLNGSWETPIKSVINFCNYCKDIGIATMIVTARGGWETNIENTKRSLQKLGIQCDAMFFRNPDDYAIETFKTNVRRYLSNTLDFNILMSIGDNSWDYGEYGGIGVHMDASPKSNAVTYQLHSKHDVRGVKLPSLMVRGRAYE